MTSRYCWRCWSRWDLSSLNTSRLESSTRSISTTLPIFLEAWGSKFDTSGPIAMGMKPAGSCRE